MTGVALPNPSVAFPWGGMPCCRNKADPLGRTSPIGLRILPSHSLRQRNGLALAFIRLLRLFFCLVNLDQCRPPPRCVVQRLRRRRRLGMLAGILLVNLGLLRRTLGSGLPIATQLVVNEVKGGQIGPLCPGKFLHHFLHPVVVYLPAQERLLLPRRRF